MATPVTTTTALNLRPEPNTSKPPILTIPKGGAVSLDSLVPVNGWYAVTYNGHPGWVSGKYLSGIPPADTDHAAARDALLSYLHIPYIWGGQSRNGLDCSGLVGEWWKQIGFRPAGFDTTADKLYDSYRTGSLPGTKLTTGQFGALAFYGSGTNASHVAICYDDVTVIGANGGSKSMDTAAKARAKNACVRMDRIDYRADLLGIWLPSY